MWLVSDFFYKHGAVCTHEADTVLSEASDPMEIIFGY